MRTLVITAALAAFPSLAPAEFLRIDQPLGGIECASCLPAVRSAIGRIRGVESVEITGDSTARVRLKPENRVRLEAIRDAAKGSGFTPGEAQVEARGKIAGSPGSWSLEILGLAQTYQLDLPDSAPSFAAGDTVIVEGAVPVPARPADQPVLRARSVRPSPGP